MKINAKQSPSGLLAGLGPLGENRRVDGIDTRAAPPEPEGDQVVLSPAAREVQEALRRIRSLPDASSEAVAALKEQVQRNTYAFDFRFIARKMITEQLVNQAL
jgi:anti-sigma28 factor (negative regulator of flagellin synthesis)